MFKLLLFVPIVLLAVFLIVLPIVKFLRNLTPPKKDPVLEAKMRLEIAQKELEAARLHKEAEKVYDRLYEETLEENEKDSKLRNER
jgi:hypothetical protein